MKRMREMKMAISWIGNNDLDYLWHDLLSLVFGLAPYWALGTGKKQFTPSPCLLFEKKREKGFMIVGLVVEEREIITETCSISSSTIHIFSLGRYNVTSMVVKKSYLLVVGYDHMALIRLWKFNESSKGLQSFCYTVYWLSWEAFLSLLSVLSILGV